MPGALLEGRVVIGAGLVEAVAAFVLRERASESRQHAFVWQAGADTDSEVGPSWMGSEQMLTE